MSGARITLRMSDVEVDEIDDFLARHPEYDSRSQFIRQAIMEYIRLEERGLLKNSGMRVEVEDRVMDMLEEYVEYRYFRDVGDVVSYVLRILVSNGELAKILKSYTLGLNSLRLSEEEKIKR